MITIERSDLAALVAALAREHFSYNGQGAAALRAYRVLEEAVETDATRILLTPAAAPETRGDAWNLAREIVGDLTERRSDLDALPLEISIGLVAQSIEEFAATNHQPTNPPNQRTEP
jgi:hypothetical protein